MRRELLNKLGHEEVQQSLPTSALPAPPPAPVDQPPAAEKSMVSSTTTSASCTPDAQINSKIIIVDADQTADSLQKISAVPAPGMVQAPREQSPVAAAESKQSSSIRIIRKSMFKFVIKLGSAAVDNGAGQYPTACRQ
jgi:hypothetical protein